MIKIFISSHGKLASGMKSAIDILLGNSDTIYVFDAYLDEKSINDILDTFYNVYVDKKDQVLLLSDLYGGSVNTAMVPYIEKENTILISGFNLGLVIELAKRKDPLTKHEVNQIIQEVKNGIKVVEITNDDIEEDFF